MPLDPQFRVALDTFEAKGLLPLVRGDAATTRAHYRRLALSRRGADYVPEQVASAADQHSPGGVPVRIGSPEPVQDVLGVVETGRERVLGREPVVDRDHPRPGRVGHAAAQRVVRLDVTQDPAAAMQVDQRAAARVQRLVDPDRYPAR